MKRRRVPERDAGTFVSAHLRRRAEAFEAARLAYEQTRPNADAWPHVRAVLVEAERNLAQAIGPGGRPVIDGIRYTPLFRRIVRQPLT